MEEKPGEFNSICFLEKTLSSPLFSTLVTLYTLVLLYFPRHFMGIVFSPILISTGFLFLTLLRLGAIQRIERESNSDSNSISTQIENTHHDSTANEDLKWVSPKSNSEPEPELGSDPDPFYVESFVEWDLRAPLEVIYEAYEGEEEEQNDDVSNQKTEAPVSSIDRYPSLSLYYPESDSGDSSDGDFPAIGGWDSPENLCFRWEEESREELIEIELDGKRASDLFLFEEENLIEIDISPARIPAGNGEFPGDG